MQDLSSLHVSSVTTVLSDYVTQCTIALQASVSLGFSRQEYWLPCPSSGDLPYPEILTSSPALQADPLLLSLWGSLLVP